MKNTKRNENERLLLLMNIDMKSFNKPLVSQIKQLKKYITTKQVSSK